MNIALIVVTVLAVLAVLAYSLALVVLTADEVVARSTALAAAFGRRR